MVRAYHSPHSSVVPPPLSDADVYPCVLLVAWDSLLQVCWPTATCRTRTQLGPRGGWAGSLCMALLANSLSLPLCDAGPRGQASQMHAPDAAWTSSAQAADPQALTICATSSRLLLRMRSATLTSTIVRVCGWAACHRRWVSRTMSVTHPCDPLLCMCSLHGRVPVRCCCNQQATGRC